MAISQALQSAIDDILAEPAEPAGMTFPTPREIVKIRLKAANPAFTDAYLDSQLQAGSALETQVKLEIANAKAQLQELLEQPLLLATPITAKMAITKIKTLLPPLLANLVNLGVEPPESLLPILQGVAVAKILITTAGVPLVGPLGPLKTILGLT